MVEFKERRFEMLTDHKNIGEMLGFSTSGGAIKSMVYDSDGEGPLNSQVFFSKLKEAEATNDRPITHVLLSKGLETSLERTSIKPGKHVESVTRPVDFFFFKKSIALPLGRLRAEERSKLTDTELKAELDELSDKLFNEHELIENQGPLRPGEKYRLVFMGPLILRDVGAQTLATGASDGRARSSLGTPAPFEKMSFAMYAAHDRNLKISGAGFDDPKTVSMEVKDEGIFNKNWNDGRTSVAKALKKAQEKGDVTHVLISRVRQDKDKGSFQLKSSFAAPLQEDLNAVRDKLASGSRALYNPRANAWRLVFLRRDHFTDDALGGRAA